MAQAEEAGVFLEESYARFLMSRGLRHMAMPIGLTMVSGCLPQFMGCCGILPLFPYTRCLLSVPSSIHLLQPRNCVTAVTDLIQFYKMCVPLIISHWCFITMLEITNIIVWYRLKILTKIQTYIHLIIYTFSGWEHKPYCSHAIVLLSAMVKCWEA